MPAGRVADVYSVLDSYLFQHRVERRPVSRQNCLKLRGRNVAGQDTIFVRPVRAGRAARGQMKSMAPKWPQQCNYGDMRYTDRHHYAQFRWPLGKGPSSILTVYIQAH